MLSVFLTFFLILWKFSGEFSGKEEVEIKERERRRRKKKKNKEESRRRIRRKRKGGKKKESKIIYAHFYTRRSWSLLLDSGVP